MICSNKLGSRLDDAAGLQLLGSLSRTCVLRKSAPWSFGVVGISMFRFDIIVISDVMPKRIVKAHTDRAVLKHPDIVDGQLERSSGVSL
jgi:hypothetical protein